MKTLIALALAASIVAACAGGDLKTHNECAHEFNRITDHDPIGVWTATGSEKIRLRNELLDLADRCEAVPGGYSRDLRQFVHDYLY